MTKKAKAKKRKVPKEQERERKFPPEVAKELGHYVYRLIDPRNGETFYVGKGKNNRVFEHALGVLKLPKVSKQEGKPDWLSEKMQVIYDIQFYGFSVLHIIHRHGMTEKEALKVEAALIDVYPGLTNEMAGHDAARGPANAYQLITEYGAEEMQFAKGDKILLLKTSDWRVRDCEGDIYEATRSAWRVSKSRAEGANYIFAIVNQICRGIFENAVWEAAHDGRWAFTADRVDEKSEIAKRYLHKRVSKKFASAQNPVGYVNF